MNISRMILDLLKPTKKDAVIHKHSSLILGAKRQVLGLWNVRYCVLVGSFSKGTENS